jgi:hypothetical protein
VLVAAGGVVLPWEPCCARERVRDAASVWVQAVQKVLCIAVSADNSFYSHRSVRMRASPLRYSLLRSSPRSSLPSCLSALASWGRQQWAIALCAEPNQIWLQTVSRLGLRNEAASLLLLPAFIEVSESHEGRPSKTGLGSSGALCRVCRVPTLCNTSCYSDCPASARPPR